MAFCKVVVSSTHVHQGAAVHFHGIRSLVHLALEGHTAPMVSHAKLVLEGLGRTRARPIACLASATSTAHLVYASRVHRLKLRLTARHGARCAQCARLQLPVRLVMSPVSAAAQTTFTTHRSSCSSASIKNTRWVNIRQLWPSTLQRLRHGSSASDAQLMRWVRGASIARREQHRPSLPATQYHSFPALQSLDARCSKLRARFSLRSAAMTNSISRSFVAQQIHPRQGSAVLATEAICARLAPMATE